MYTPQYKHMTKQFKTKEEADGFNRLMNLNDGHVYYNNGYWYCDYYRRVN